MEDKELAALNKKMQRLEHKKKKLLTEILFMDRLFRMIGFPNGIESLKESAKNSDT